MCDKVKQLEAQLAEALGLLRKIADWPNGGNQYGQENIKNAAKAFLAHYVQAEQQEAQGVQAGDDAVRKDAERYKFLKSEVNPSLMERLDCNYPSTTWDAHIDAAMHAQGDGDETKC